MNAVKIENLNYMYPDGRVGLRDISFTIEKGARVALIGSNGSGKSTLLLHLNGLLDGEGKIEIMGIRRSKKNISKIRRSIGYLFSQVDYQFIMPDLLNDVMLSISEEGTKESKMEKAREWLVRLGLTDYEEVSPLELSAGEMKKAALAGILARNPSLLILDEPLNTLDRKASKELMNILKDLPQTMIFATHRILPVKDIATHIAVMNKGKITGYHTVNEGLMKKEVLKLLM